MISRQNSAITCWAAGLLLLGLLHLDLVLAVAEAHDLDVTAGGFVPVPVRADLLVRLELVAPELGERRAEPAEQPGVLGPLFTGDDITVGLEQHQEASLSGATCHTGSRFILPQCRGRGKQAGSTEPPGRRAPGDRPIIRPEPDLPPLPCRGPKRV